MFEHRTYYDVDNLALQALIEAGTVDPTQFYPLLVNTPHRSPKSITTTDVEVEAFDENDQPITVTEARSDRILLIAKDQEAAATLEAFAATVDLEYVKLTADAAKDHVRTSSDWTSAA